MTIYLSKSYVGAVYMKLRSRILAWLNQVNTELRNKPSIYHNIEKLIRQTMQKWRLIKVRVIFSYITSGDHFIRNINKNVVIYGDQNQSAPELNYIYIYI